MLRIAHVTPCDSCATFFIFILPRNCSPFRGASRSSGRCCAWRSPATRSAPRGWSGHAAGCLGGPRRHRASGLYLGLATKEYKGYQRLIGILTDLDWSWLILKTDLDWSWRLWRLVVFCCEVYLILLEVFGMPLWISLVGFWLFCMGRDAKATRSGHT